MPGLEHAAALAIDLGGSHVTCALVRQRAILGAEILPASGKDTLSGLLPSIARSLHRLVSTGCQDSPGPVGVVLGFPGIVNAREKRVLATNDKFSDATTLDLSDWCAREFSLPFFLENDARLALLGEHAYGAAMGADDAVMVTLGSGIGAAAMLNGRLLQSKNGLAGMIGGHLPVSLHGRRCTCGNCGCAESEGSTGFLEKVFEQVTQGAQPSLAPGSGFAELFQAVDRGDRAAQSVLAHCLRVWSVLTVALIHAYDPETIVFGGSVMKRAADILPHIQKYVDAHAWTPGRTVPLRVSVFGSEAALYGATPLIESSL